MSVVFGQKVIINIEEAKHRGYIEKEYENSYLVCIDDPSPEILEKYTNRMVVSKKNCAVTCNQVG